MDKNLDLYNSFMEAFISSQVYRVIIKSPLPKSQRPQGFFDMIVLKYCNKSTLGLCHFQALAPYLCPS